MKEAAIARFDYPKELKEKLIELVVYQNYSKEEVAKSKGLRFSAYRGWRNWSKKTRTLHAAPM